MIHNASQKSTGRNSRSPLTHIIPPTDFLHMGNSLLNPCKLLGKHLYACLSSRQQGPVRTAHMAVNPRSESSQVKLVSGC
jgi:hypothetical protein